jgi:predicted dehydrogenase
LDHWLKGLAMRRNLLAAMSGMSLIMGLLSCAESGKRATVGPAEDAKVRLVVLDPGHYHAALVQKTMYAQVDPTVHVYAPDGPEVQEYLGRIQDFNNRAEDPTRWEEEVYVGSDYLEKMLTDKAGDIVVLSGNNRRKTEYIMAAIDAGLNVYSDKPMCIDAEGFRTLEQAFVAARKKRLLLFDIMTERYNTLRLLQKALVLDEDVFGELEKGSPDDPAVITESVHHFFKYVSGQPIRRPTWYFDTTQQGEGLVDVTTHLIDLVTWTCFPAERINYRRDVAVLRARRWPTMITQPQYEKVTRAPEFPDYLRGKLNAEDALPYYCNGEMVYAMKGVHVKLTVTWKFEAPEGAGDTHYSLLRGNRAHVIIRQGKEQGYKPKLYVEPAPGTDIDRLRRALDKAVARFQDNHPGLALAPRGLGWEVVVPAGQITGHEAHFRNVTEQYLDYLHQGRLPQWETDYMRSKYYITTKALELARQ